MKRPVLTAFCVLLLAGCAHLRRPDLPIVELEYPAGLAVITRSQWGSLPLRKTLPQHSITKVTIHHGGENFPTDKDPVQYLRNLQTWSRSAEKNWIDIPYHFMIDPDGRIYEARPINYPGATNTSYDPTGHALICVMGNYENQILSDQQLQTVVDLTAFLVRLYGVDLNDIKGHKDYAETLCPGQDLYRYLEDGTIRTKVAEKVMALF